MTSLHERDLLVGELHKRMQECIESKIRQRAQTYCIIKWAKYITWQSVLHYKVSTNALHYKVGSNLLPYNVGTNVLHNKAVGKNVLHHKVGTNILHHKVGTNVNCMPWFQYKTFNAVYVLNQ